LQHIENPCQPKSQLSLQPASSTLLPRKFNPPNPHTGVASLIPRCESLPRLQKGNKPNPSLPHHHTEAAVLGRISFKVPSGAVWQVGRERKDSYKSIEGGSKRCSGKDKDGRASSRLDSREAASCTKKHSEEGNTVDGVRRIERTQRDAKVEGSCDCKQKRRPSDEESPFPLPPLTPQIVTVPLPQVVVEEQ